MGSVATPWRLEGLAPHTSVDRESTINNKCTACERTNVAQLMRGRAMDVSWHADHGDMRFSRRRARIEERDTHTRKLHPA